MHVLLVHGLGRSPLSMLGLARALEAAGHTTERPGYLAAIESFAAIRARLRRRLLEAAYGGPCAAIGHSLGGVLLRAALTGWPAGAQPPQRLITLGSPTQAPALARALRTTVGYRVLAGDCGTKLASPGFFARLGASPVPITTIAGTRGWPLAPGPLRGRISDGIVALDETFLAGASERLLVPGMHTFLMNSRAVRRAILARLEPWQDPGAEPTPCA